MDDCKWCFEINTLSLTVAIPKNYSALPPPPKKKLRLQVLQKSSSLEKVAVPKVTPTSEMYIIALLKKLNNRNRCCEIVKVTHSPQEWDRCQCLFLHLTQYFSNKKYCN